MSFNNSSSRIDILRSTALENGCHETCCRAGNEIGERGGGTSSSVSRAHGGGANGTIPKGSSSGGAPVHMPSPPDECESLSVAPVLLLALLLLSSSLSFQNLQGLSKGI